MRERLDVRKKKKKIKCTFILEFESIYGKFL